MNEILLYLREFNQPNWMIFYVTDTYVLEDLRNDTKTLWQQQVNYTRCFYNLDTKQFMQMNASSKDNGIHSGDHLVLV